MLEHYTENLFLLQICMKGCHCGDQLHPFRLSKDGNSLGKKKPGFQMHRRVHGAQLRAGGEVFPYNEQAHARGTPATHLVLPETAVTIEQVGTVICECRQFTISELEIIQCKVQKWCRERESTMVLNETVTKKLGYHTFCAMPPNLKGIHLLVKCFSSYSRVSTVFCYPAGN